MPEQACRTLGQSSGRGLGALAGRFTARSIYFGVALGHPKALCHHPNRALLLAPTPCTAGRDGRKPQHSISGKMTPRRKNVLLRPHDMIRIAHTELCARNLPARTSRPCPDNRPRAASVPHACFMCAAWPGLCHMPLPDRGFAGRGDVFRPRPPARTEGTILWRTHAQTVRCVHSCSALYDNKVS